MINYTILEAQIISNIFINLILIRLRLPLKKLEFPHTPTQKAIKPMYSFIIRAPKHLFTFKINIINKLEILILIFKTFTVQEIQNDIKEK